VVPGVTAALAAGAVLGLPLTDRKSASKLIFCTAHHAADKADCTPIWSGPLVARPQTGPPRHIHHREDEWYYVLAGEFLFEVDGVKYTLPVGGSIWAPRDIPHVWANTSTTEGRVILMCQPGGFENFFDAFVKGMIDKVSPAQMEQIHARYGMEMLGPPLFPPTA
jgi:mannose-6-phosphate isomerase-like protein (cupin superfamily)